MSKYLSVAVTVTAIFLEYFHRAFRRQLHALRDKLLYSAAVYLTHRASEVRRSGRILDDAGAVIYSKIFGSFRMSREY